MLSKNFRDSDYTTTFSSGEWTIPTLSECRHSCLPSQTRQNDRTVRLNRVHISVRAPYKYSVQPSVTHMDARSPFGEESTRYEE